MDGHVLNKMCAEGGMSQHQAYNWPVAIDWQRQAFLTQHVTRHELADASFLDHRLRSNGLMDVVNFQDIVSPVGHRPPSYIIHSAFCGSTLLARLLDHEGECLALKEPNVLAQLATAKRKSGGTARALSGEQSIYRILGLAHQLMVKEQYAATLIKPTNFANNLIPEIMQSGARVLFLYSTLESFLRSVVKRGEEGHVFVRQRWQTMLAEREPISHIQPEVAMLYTDLQIGAIIWAQQIDTFQYWLQHDEGQRCASANFADYRPDPYAFLASVATFLACGKGVRSDGATLQEKSVLDSKTNTVRSAVEAADKISANDEAVIADVLAWAKSIHFGTPIELPLAHDVMARP